MIKINFSNVNINKPTMLNYNSGKEEIKAQLAQGAQGGQGRFRAWG